MRDISNRWMLWKHHREYLSMRKLVFIRVIICLADYIKIGKKSLVSCRIMIQFLSTDKQLGQRSILIFTFCGTKMHYIYQLQSFKINIDKKRWEKIICYPICHSKCQVWAMPFSSLSWYVMIRYCLSLLCDGIKKEQSKLQRSSCSFWFVKLYNPPSVDLDFGRDVDDSSFKRTENQFWHWKAFGGKKKLLIIGQQSRVIKTIKDLYDGVFVIICSSQPVRMSMAIGTP